MMETLAGEELQFTTEEEYRALLRSLRRRKGFGIIFVQCTPVGGQELIKKIGADLPKNCSEEKYQSLKVFMKLGITKVML